MQSNLQNNLSLDLSSDLLISKSNYINICPVCLNKKHLLKTNCEHYYCIDCITDMYQYSAKYNENFNKNVNISIDYVFLDDDERKKFASHKHEYLINVSDDDILTEHIEYFSLSQTNLTLCNENN